MSPAINLENARYVCQQHECLAIFKNITQWKRHAPLSRFKCRDAGVTSLNDFIPTLERAGFGSKIVAHFLDQWEKREKRDKLPPLWALFPNSPWMGAAPYGDTETSHDMNIDWRAFIEREDVVGFVPPRSANHSDANPPTVNQPATDNELRHDGMDIDTPSARQGVGVNEQSQGHERDGGENILLPDQTPIPNIPGPTDHCDRDCDRPPSVPPPPPQLYNPLHDGKPPCYTRTVTDKYIVYKHATAGAIIPKGPGANITRWEQLRRDNLERTGGNPYGVWGSKRNWEDAKWMATAKVSKGKLDELLGTARYVDDPPDFKTTDNLFQTIEEHLSGFGGPEWYSHRISLPEAHRDSETLYYRCPRQCGDCLFRTVRFTGNIAVAPELIFELDDVTRVYQNLYNGNDWDRIQRRLPQGTTRGATIFMSDATILSRFSGGVQVHGLYMSLGNIDKAIREDISKGAWMLIAYIPKSNFEKTMSRMGHLSKAKKSALVNLLNRRLFHRCMDIICRPFRCTEPHEVMDPDGNIRSVLYDLAVYGADLEEQCMIGSIERNSCPHCGSKGDELGNPTCQCRRSSSQVWKNIKKTLSNFHRKYKQQPDPLEFLKECKEYALNGVHKPFWRRFHDFDIYEVLSPDLLHAYHKFFFDHIHKWNLTGLGADEYDTRLKAQIPYPGEKMFPRGVSTLKQLAGKDHRALERVHVGVVAHAPSVSEGGAGSNRLMKATQSILDCIFLAQYPIHTDNTLADYQSSYETFHEHKQVWIDNQSKRGKSTRTEKINVNKSWAIPKLHIMRHAPDHVRAKGTLDNYNTETMEHLHRSHCKDPYELTNRRGWESQVLRRLKRYEKVRDYGEWIEWNLEQLAKENEAAEMEPSEYHDEQDERDEREEQGEQIEVGGTEGEDEEGARGQGVVEIIEGRSRDEGASTLETRESLQSLAIELTENHVAEGVIVTESGENRSHLGHAKDRSDNQLGRTLLRARPAKRVCPLFYVQGSAYLVAKRANHSSIPAFDLVEKMDIPDFLDDLATHPHFKDRPWDTNARTNFHLWDSARLRIPTSTFSPEARVARVFVISGLPRQNNAGPTARSDAIFYRSASASIDHEASTIHDYRVGRLKLIFSVSPSPTDPSPRMMAYVQRFTKISRHPSGNSGFYAVGKAFRNNRAQYECVPLEQVIRPCPLSPIFDGSANPDVEGHASLDHYYRFYINKYRNPHDYAWIHQG